jgi:hypothetical protein
MHIYLTSKNAGPNWDADPMTVVYLGASYHDAKAVVPAIFQRNEDDVSKYRYPQHYTACPIETDHKFCHLYTADGWWYSIVKITL